MSLTDIEREGGGPLTARRCSERADWTTLRQQADWQLDLITREQCLAAGLTSHFIAWRLTSKRWVAKAPGVYLTRPGRSGWEVEALARYLSHGDPLAFAGASAAQWWGWTTHGPQTLHFVTALHRRLSPGPQVRIRRVRHFERVVHPAAWPPRTTRAATVLDQAAAASSEDAAIATVANAVQRRFVAARELVTELGQRRQHPFGRLLREVLLDVAEGAESAAEVRYIRDVERAHGLPKGVRQAATDAGRARAHDTGYCEYRLLVEVDGRVAHEGWARRVSDALRDRETTVAGEVTVRLMWPDVTSGACRSARDIAALLQQRGWTGEPHPCRRPGCVIPRRG